MLIFENLPKTRMLHRIKYCGIIDNYNPYFLIIFARFFKDLRHYKYMIQSGDHFPEISLMLILLWVQQRFKVSEYQFGGDFVEDRHYCDRSVALGLYTIARLEENNNSRLPPYFWKYCMLFKASIIVCNNNFPPKHQIIIIWMLLLWMVD